MYRSVCLLVLFAISASGLTFKKADEKCRNETGISDSGTTIHSDNVVSLSSVTKCYEACMHREDGELDKNGIITPKAIELFSSYLNGSDVMKAIRSCANQTIGDFCETASKSLECYRQIQEEHFLTAHSNCLTETSMSDETIDTFNLRLLIQDPNTTCYAGCMLREIGYLNTDGTPRSSQIKYRMTNCTNCDENLRTFNSCNSQITTGKFCETAAKSYECLLSAEIIFEFLTE